MKVFKITSFIIGGLILSVFAFRACVFEAGNLMGHNTILSTVDSPKGEYVLTVIKGDSPLPEEGGKTIFILSEQGKKIVLTRNNVFSGKKEYPDGDILEIEGGFFPYGIVWLDDHNLLINLKHPIEWQYKDGYGYTEKMYSKKKEQWGDVKISFGLLGEKKYSNEISISNQPATSLK